MGKLRGAVVGTGGRGDSKAGCMTILTHYCSAEKAHRHNPDWLQDTCFSPEGSENKKPGKHWKARPLFHFGFPGGQISSVSLSWEGVIYWINSWEENWASSAWLCLLPLAMELPKGNTSHCLSDSTAPSDPGLLARVGWLCLTQSPASWPIWPSYPAMFSNSSFISNTFISDALILKDKRFIT